MEKCANCDRVIGKLETPFIFDEDTVCQQCHHVLTEVGSPAVTEELSREASARVSLEPTAPVRSTWTPERAGRIARNKKGVTPGKIVAALLFAMMLIGAALAVAAPNSDFLGLFIVLFLLPISVLMAWAPIGIAKGKGREDKTSAIGALSVLGILTGGLLWIAALVWSLALDKSRTA
ncbi:MAG TPA: hypothetical protein VF595_10555 [Tepidisphaeraceae bacterium]|jgi:hypothetical protein